MQKELDAPTYKDICDENLYNELLDLEPYNSIQRRGHCISKKDNEMYIVDDVDDLFFYQVLKILLI